MEVKPGYKMTEMGVIPEDWEVTRLGEASDVLTGFPFPSHEFSSLGVRLLRGSNVKRNAIDWDEAITKNWPAISSDLNKYELREGDIVIAMDGALVGRSFATVSKEDLPALLVQRVARLRSRKTEQKLIGSWINSDHFIRHVDLVKTHTAIPHISPKDIREFTLAVPREETEQRAIATALSDMDALLDGLDRLIAKKRAIKRATMQQLLTGQTRLPGFSGEWEEKRLGDHLTFLKNGVNSRAELSYSEEVRYLHYGDIHGSSRVELNPANVEMPCLPRAKASRLDRLQNGDLIFADASEDMDGVGKSVEIKNAAGIELVSGLHTIAIRLDKSVLADGFKAYIQFIPKFRAHLRQLAAGTKVYATNRTHIASAELRLPDIDEQQAISALLTDMDAEITALENRHNKTRALKQAMMQELLTGRTRLVKSAEKPDEEAAAQTEGRKANVHFLRSVLAAEIIDQLHDQPTFGHVKFEKMMFLAEHLCQVDTGSTYHRKAAGPYDNRAIRSIDSQLRKQQWFEARKQDGRYQYVPLAKRGGHKPYFERHFSGIAENLEKILGTFKTAKTEQCEIVATLLAAWSDLLREKGTVSDEMIVHEVLHNWHEAKQRIPEDRWLVALGWMRQKGFVPKGATLP
ncbi:TPA: restriction endonuclease subunit S [Pseudomonas aeruginosa]|nr:restriction endonuclease subunit S [Pseudomonas aeruginosa]HCD6628999.1 restriction endonuclease subunit S [Pseudomonas aeruginosa]